MALLLAWGAAVDHQSQKAFDFAQGAVKQLITLATGMIALSITFAKDFVSTVPAAARMMALWSWGAFLLSVLCGLWALLALTGTLEADPAVPVSIRGKNVTIPTALQIALFVAGLGLTVGFGIVATSGVV